MCACAKCNSVFSDYKTGQCSKFSHLKTEFWAFLLEKIVRLLADFIVSRLTNRLISDGNVCYTPSEHFLAIFPPRNVMHTLVHSYTSVKLCLCTSKGHVSANMQGVHVFVCMQPVYFGSRVSLLLSVWREVPGRKGLRQQKKDLKKKASGGLEW